MGEFTHFNKEGNAVMVDVHAKDDTYRVAVAAGQNRHRRQMMPEVILLVWMMQAAQDWMILETLAGLICLETVRQKKPKLLRMA